MSYINFLDLLINNINYFYISVLISLVIYFPIMKRASLHVLDPYFLAIIFSEIGFIVVVFLEFTKAISYMYFLQYIFTQFTFYFGFFIFYPQFTIKKIQETQSKTLILTSSEKCLFMFSISIFVFSTLLSYYLTGVPLFLDSRLEIYAEGKGSGLFLRLADFFSYICLYYSFYFIFKKKRTKMKLYSIVFLFFYIITLFLSAKKSSIVGFFQYFFCFSLFNINSLPNVYKMIKRNMLKIIIVSVCFIGGGFIYRYNGNINEAFTKFAFRLVAQGDAFFLAYPNHVVEKIPSYSKFSMFFYDFFRTIRVIPGSFAPPSIGKDLYQLVTGTDYLSGSVVNHNLLGLIQFGFLGSMVFSFFCGVLIKKIRTFCFQIYTESNIKKIFLIYLLIKSSHLEYAFTAFTTDITNLLIFGFCLVVVNFMIKEQYNPSFKNISA